jgi:hypothetical protein
MEYTILSSVVNSIIESLLEEGNSNNIMQNINAALLYYERIGEFNRASDIRRKYKILGESSNGIPEINSLFRKTGDDLSSGFHKDLLLALYFYKASGDLMKTAWMQQTIMQYIEQHNQEEFVFMKTFLYEIHGYALLQYNGKSSNIIIPSNYKGLPITIIDESAFSNNEEVVSVQLPESIKRIESYVFLNCINLSNVVFPSNLEYIGRQAFDNCRSLVNVYLPDSVHTLGAHCFDSCVNLRKVFLSNQIERIGIATFCDCVNLEAINLPNKLKEISMASFKNCHQLKQIFIPESLEKIDDISFENCRNLIIYITENHKKTLYSNMDQCVNCGNIVSIDSISFINEKNKLDIFVKRSDKQLDSDFNTFTDIDNIVKTIHLFFEFLNKNHISTSTEDNQKMKEQIQIAIDLRIKKKYSESILVLLNLLKKELNLQLLELLYESIAISGHIKEAVRLLQMILKSSFIQPVNNNDLRFFTEHLSTIKHVIKREYRLVDYLRNISGTLDYNLPIDYDQIIEELNKIAY